MTPDDQTHHEALSLSQLRLIDQACDQFESEWVRGNVPSIASYLDEADPFLRPRLLRQLIMVDKDYRQRLGRQAEREDYTRQFSDYSAVIDSIFAEDLSTGARQSDRSTVLVDEFAMQADSAAAQRDALRERIGRFRILRPLGKGSFGTVYLALDEDLQREVAIKIAHRARLSPSGEDLELHEARMAAGLDHAAIVPVLECGRMPDGNLYVVSKLIAGTDLKSRVEEFSFPIRAAAQLIATIAEAAHYAHVRGLIHRDIKPANILINEDHRPFLTDFGLALRTELTGTGEAFVGTPAYMSPEQARMEGHLVDARSDVFSLTVVLYELVFCRLPFCGDTRQELLAAIQRAEPPDLAADFAVPAQLTRIICKGLARRASDRYQTAQELAEELLAWLAESGDGGVGTTSTTASLADAAVIVPKGLRSFEQQDASFFQQLIPGPRDPNGLPESISFWKARIESGSLDKAFRVGVLYGPTGSGKSSFVNAGLISQLDRSIITIRATATAEHTESQLLHALRRQFPAIARETKLPDVLRELRDGRMSRENKLLVVIDQFEQWLGDHREFDTEPLVAALRQCDGVRVQCLLLARDDLWLELTQCLRAAEVELDGLNSRATDLFDRQHAARVLTDFGRAYGTISTAEATAPPGSQQDFVAQAIEQMDCGDGLIPIRLALFADVMKNRAWTLTELRRVGGVDAATSLFLDKIVDGDAAHPTLAKYSDEVAFLLQELVPPSGSLIKSRPTTRAELAVASGLDQQTADQIIELLDHEFRIVAPHADTPDDVSDAVRFQLSHDYLVPIVRQWLQRKLGGTFSGRMELVLGERTKSWSADRRRRNLPGPMEWGGIALTTKRSRWSHPSQRLMRSASGYYVSLFFLIGIAMMGTLLLARSRITALRLASAIEQLASADTSQVPQILEELVAFGDRVPAAVDRLGARPADRSQNDWALELAKYGAGTSTIDQVLQHLNSSMPEQIRIICDRLRRSGEAIPTTALDDLWAELATAERARPDAVRRLGSVLAQLDPHAAQWPEISGLVVTAVCAAPDGEFLDWVELIQPVSLTLARDVVAAIADETTSPSQASRAVGMVESYYRDDVNLLVAAITHVSPGDFHRLARLLPDEPGTILRLERTLAALQRPPEKLDISVDLPAALQDQLQRFGGLVTPVFALALDIPREQFQQVDQGLKTAGYVLRRCRPRDAYCKSLSGVWRKEKKQRKVMLLWDMSRQELIERDTVSRDGWSPVDVACYLDAEGTTRFVACWHEKRRTHDETIRVFDWHLPLEYLASGTFAYRCLLTISVGPSSQGQVLFCVVDRAASSGTDGWTARAGLLPGAIQHAIDPVNFATDICFSPAHTYAAAQRAQLEQLEMSATTLDTLTDPRNRGTFEFRQARALYRAGKFQESSDKLDRLAGPGRTVQIWSKEYRALAAAQLGQKEKALRYLNEALEKIAALDDQIYYASIVRELCQQDGLEMLGQALEAHPDNDLLVVNTALACGEVADFLKERHPERYLKCLKLMVDSVNQLEERQVYEISLEEHPRLIRHLEAARDSIKLPNQRLHLVYHSAVSLDQRATSGTVDDIQTVGKSLAEDGFVAQAVACEPRDANSHNDSDVFHVLWYRRRASFESRLESTRQQARLVSALLQLGSDEAARRALDDVTATSLAHDVVALAQQRGIRGECWWRIAHNSDSPRQRCMALWALAQYPDALDDSDDTWQLLGQWYQEERDAGIHGAVRQLWHRSGDPALRETLDETLAGSENESQANWFVNGQGMTFSIIHGSNVFAMGSPNDEPLRIAQSEIFHRREIARTYAISTTEVTNQQFGRFRQHADLMEDDLPCSASWFEAVAFCRWLSEQEDLPEEQMCYPPLDQIGPGMIMLPDYLDKTGYRLPSEAEWEFACRAGCKLAWSFGLDQNLLEHFGVYDKTALASALPVGSRLPNLLGLFDTHGNMSEWCQDELGVYNFRLGRRPRLDTAFPGRIAEQSLCASRGGNFRSPAGDTRCAVRAEEAVTDRAHYQGFRVVRTIE